MKQTHHIGYVQTPSVKNLSNVKNALVENGLVSLTTPNEMLGVELTKTVTELKSRIPETWETMDLSTKQKIITKNYDYIFHHSNGIDVYGSYKDSTKKGLYHVNGLTGETTQIYTQSYYWDYFFEASDGTLYVGSNSNRYDGLLKVNGTTASKIYKESGQNFGFFEASDGKVYYGNNADGLKLLNSVDGAIILYNTGRYWCKNYYENKNGDVYICGEAGILHIKNDEVSLIFNGIAIYSVSFFEAKNGIVYVGENSSSLKGVLKLVGQTATPILNTLDYSYLYFFEAKNGYVYASSDRNTNLICILGETYTYVSATTKLKYWYENKNGDIYVSSSGSNGLYHLKGTAITNIYSKTPIGWQVYYENENGDVYLSANSVDNNGVIRFSGTTLKNEYLYGKGWKYFTKRNEGLIVAKTPQPDGEEFMLIDEENNIFYVVRGEQE